MCYDWYSNVVFISILYLLPILPLKLSSLFNGFKWLFFFRTYIYLFKQIRCETTVWFLLICTCTKKTQMKQNVGKEYALVLVCMLMMNKNYCVIVYICMRAWKNTKQIKKEEERKKGRMISERNKWFCMKYSMISYVRMEHFMLVWRKWWSF